MNDNYLAALAPGVFVAVYISNYKKRPVIGKVIEVGEDKLKLNYWKGSYNTPWQPHMVETKDGPQAWSDEIWKQSVIMCAFELDEKNHLFENTRKYLKRWYRDQAKRLSEAE